MTPSAIIALVRDALIVGALAFLTWRIYQDGENHIKVTDIQAVQKQLQENAQHAAQYALQSQQADAQRAQDLAQVSAAIAAQQSPIWLYRPSGGSPVSCPATRPSPQSPSTGGIVEPSRADPQPVDIREPINAYEQRLETLVADCRAAIEKWPK